MLRRSGLLLGVLTLAACSDAGGPTQAPALAPRAALSATSSSVIPDHYIVVFRGSVRDPRTQAAALAARHGATVGHTYASALRGFSAVIPASAVAALTADPSVEYVEPDQVARIVTVQTPATWGLDRVDQRDLPLNNSYTYNVTGAGVNVYIIDTGIRTTHTEFGGRAVGAFGAVNDGNGTNDCNGHGTHVSGTAGGATYGVAKNVQLYAVRVLDCAGSGSYADVIAGVDWVTANRVNPAVANMSLGGPTSTALDQAVVNSINSGVTYAISAGNDNTNACNGSPARVAQAITVGSTMSTDARSSFSNTGSCVDIFAPGSSITSAWNTSDVATAVLSGTSMSSPHVAGAAALYLSANPTATPAAVATALTDSATNGKVTDPGAGSPNKLLYTAFIGGTPPPNPLVVSFTWSCTNLVCNFSASASGPNRLSSASWDFGDGTGAGKVQKPSHTYAAAGSYTVTFTATDVAGNTSSATNVVTVTSPPPPGPVVDFTFTCSGLTCNFSGTVTNANGVASAGWTFGDGTTAGKVERPSKTYLAPGSYSVTFTVTDRSGLTGSKTRTVTVP